MEQVAPLEHILVERCGDARARRRCAPLTQATRLRLDPDGVLADDNRAHERRWFNLDQTYGGEWFAQGQLDAEGGALVKTLLDAISRAAPVPATRARHRSAVPTRWSILPPRNCAAASIPSVHGQRPHLTVTVSAAALRTGADAEAAVLQRRGTDPSGNRTAHRLRRGADRGDRGAACGRSRAWLRQSTTPVVPLSVGRATRTIPAHIRTALLLRDNGCRFPGCDRPPAWTDGHHIIHWADGGPTELDNLVSLCRRHHRAVHEQGWRIRMADGIPVVEAPP